MAEAKAPETPKVAALAAPSPQRQRTPGTGAPTVACPTPGQSLPLEARGLCWPASFLDAPRGERLELTESGSLATRTSGVTKGTALIGPLQLDKGSAYFEVEVVEREKAGTQTIALGICCSLPATTGREFIRAERGREMGEGCFMLGYDVPKVYANGNEVKKLNTKQWRPLKDVVSGMRLGLLVESASRELSVFVNGEKKVSASIPAAADGSQFPAEVWGVVDVHGTVRSVRLRPCNSMSAEPEELAKVVPPPPPAWAAQVAEAPARLASTQDLGAPAPTPSAAEPTSTAITDVASTGTPHAVTQDARGIARTATVLEVAAGPKKRLRLSAHPCGCMVHLIGHKGDVVHVPRKGDFVIGRNPKSCNLTLDSADVPNMISRRHAVVVSADDSVMVVDCESLNGTFVNGRRVGRETLRQGDTLTVGNPAQSPAHFRFEISMPEAER
eukprot:TRINITY_DN107642_c0_g1_i1.p1 TRINITY_DN107642_c0_g1~~TRINITY_DN107642_c0_g1_i1.p1  ORF type:complete len:444 (-),score=77.81 TRINITY_DN107642_c0_g1_i1:134-1465(-)